jgi:hypothetical protein
VATIVGATDGTALLAIELASSDALQLVVAELEPLFFCEGGQLLLGLARTRLLLLLGCQVFEVHV